MMYEGDRTRRRDGVKGFQTLQDAIPLVKYTGID